MFFIILFCCLCLNEMQDSVVHFAVVTDYRSLPFYPIKVIGIIIGYAKVGEVISIYAR